ncbi:hypothetical protein M0812_00195 [Anaeramoeba flamelloides]|uniref:Uncharacterized protein n=1 Tax=Anaeramoeba flamelloides TaxID=1746091 RepID=A0AAV8A5B2_9EUKA|nr:hypothetical protein M0812_00195 [Anaeramoeba flamelloides]
MNTTQLLEISYALLSLKRVPQKPQYFSETNEQRRLSKNMRPNLKMSLLIRNTLKQVDTKEDAQFSTYHQNALKTITSEPKGNMSRNTHSISKKQAKIINEKKQKLSAFLQTKPKPSWYQRLERFHEYDPTLIQGWKKEKKSNKSLKKFPTKIIIKKDLFHLSAELTNDPNDPSSYNRIYKSSQRGVEMYLKHNGYQRIQKYSRVSLSFEKKN